MKENMIKIDFP